MTARNQKQLAIFAIDPGGSTGVAMGIFKLEDSVYDTLKNPKPKPHTTTVIGHPLVQARQLFRLWRDFYAAALLPPTKVPSAQVWMVMEDFALSPSAAPGKDILLATKVAHTLLGYRHGAADEFDRVLANPIQPMQIAWQSASQAKSFVSDQRLRRWGLWVKGNDHERDANRHMALFLSGQIQ